MHTSDHQPNVPMRVIVSGRAMPLAIDAGPMLMRRSGPLSFDCGACGRTLIEHVDASDVLSASQFRCIACGAVNQSPQ
jgi:hypothetical protein